VPHDVGREALELIQQGLDHFAHGRLSEAAQVWETAAHLQPQDRQAARLLAFARRRLRERDTSSAPVRHDTLESPIPGYLASLTAVEDEGGGEHVESELGDEWSKVETRRVLSGMDELDDYEIHQTDAGDTWKELPAQDDKLLSSARGLVDECKTALYAGRAESAALAAEMALQMGEQARVSEVVEIINKEHPLFERAFSNFIGDVRCAPIRAIPAEDLASYGFDNRAAFLMSSMDGVTGVQDLLHVAGMPRFEALRLVAALKRAQAIDMVPDTP
jgi:hypothetical protein